MADEPKLTPIDWLGSSRDDLRDFPKRVRREIGLALMEAQGGGKLPNVKPLKGFGGAGVLEVVENYDGDAYRAVYTVNFAERIYVLHVFQKKSKQGIATPKAIIDLIRKRLKEAEKDYKGEKR